MKLENLIIIIGLTLVVIGTILKIINLNKIPLLPGDILIKKENFIFYFPIATSIIISLILTIIFMIIKK